MARFPRDMGRDTGLAQFGDKSGGVAVPGDFL
jgi:hypothetical protein